MMKKQQQPPRTEPNRRRRGRGNSSNYNSPKNDKSGKKKNKEEESQNQHQPSNDHPPQASNDDDWDSNMNHNNNYYFPPSLIGRQQQRRGTDAATLQLDMFGVIVIPCPESYESPVIVIQQEQQRQETTTTTAVDASGTNATNYSSSKDSGMDSTTVPPLAFGTTMTTTTTTSPVIKHEYNPNVPQEEQQPVEKKKDEEPEGRVLFWPCLIFRNQQQMLDIWDKYDDLYFGDCYNHTTTNFRLGEDEESYGDRLKRHIEDTMKFEYSMHLLSSSSSSSSSSCQSTKTSAAAAAAVNKPDQDAMVLLLGPDDCQPIIYNGRKRTYYYSWQELRTKQLNSSSGSNSSRARRPPSPQQDEPLPPAAPPKPLLYSMDPSVPFLFPQQSVNHAMAQEHQDDDDYDESNGWGTRLTSTNPTTTTTATTTAGATTTSSTVTLSLDPKGNKNDGVLETWQQLQRLYAHVTTGRSQSKPKPRRKAGSFQNQQQSHHEPPKFSVASSNTTKQQQQPPSLFQTTSIKRSSPPIPYYLRTPSEDEEEEGDDEEMVNDKTAEVETSGTKKNDLDRTTSIATPIAVVSSSSSVPNTTTTTIDFSAMLEEMNNAAKTSMAASALITPEKIIPSLHSTIAGVSSPGARVAETIRTTTASSNTNRNSTLTTPTPDPTSSSHPVAIDGLGPVVAASSSSSELDVSKRKLPFDEPEGSDDLGDEGRNSDGGSPCKKSKSEDTTTPIPDKATSSSSSMCTPEKIAFVSSSSSSIIPNKTASLSSSDIIPDKTSSLSLSNDNRVSKKTDTKKRTGLGANDEDEDSRDGEDDDNDPLHPQIELLPPEDQALQRLLNQDTHFEFHLLPHQFSAVRLVAGVPAQFPFHSGSRARFGTTLSLSKAVAGLYRPENQPETKGLCIADAMGLGKTVEAIAGAILRDAISVEKGEKKLPILIVSPNDAVQHQWRHTLLRNGVPDHKIVWFKKDMTQGFGTNNFVLTTRYTLQAEIKTLFDETDDEDGAYGRITDSKSKLFPYLTKSLLLKLQNEYYCAKGKRRSTATVKRTNENKEDCVTRLLKNACKNWNPEKIAFRLMIIDEAHFLKNRLTYWTLGCALSAMHSWRVVPLTGTPYNNGVSDLGTLMTLIDPTHDSALTVWWQRVLDDSQSKKSNEIKQSMGLWHQQYILRRGKEAIEHLLPAKILQETFVHMVSSQMSIYAHYEDRLADVLQEFVEELKAGEGQYKLRNMFQLLMAVMSCMRMSLLHPLLPASGREVTKLFSPSRKKVLSPRDCPDKCVCCQHGLRPSIPLSATYDPNFVELSTEDPNSSSSGGVHSNPDKMEEGENYKDDVEEVFRRDHRPVFEIPKSICNACSPVVHYAHADCIEDLKSEKGKTGNLVTCPRCLDLQNRVKGYSPLSSSPEGSKFWCKNVVDEFPSGFIGSPKLDAAVTWAQNVPVEDKMLILSFFKGSLDLMEAIFVHDLKWNCARFDGDVNNQQKNAELERFKTDPSCRVMLMTVQSGGVGLNITESNHIAFLDRWFNPFVHQQAEDRCHRLGQKKDVTVQYFDCAATIDQAMNEINKAKRLNSAILLADGVELGTTGGGVSYTDISGLVSRFIALIQRHRKQFLSDPKNRNLPIPPVPAEAMDVCANRHRQGKAIKRARHEMKKKSQLDEIPKPVATIFSDTIPPLSSSPTPQVEPSISGSTSTPYATVERDPSISISNNSLKMQPIPAEVKSSSLGSNRPV